MPNKNIHEFDRNLTGSSKKCPLLPGVRYIACPPQTGLTVIPRRNQKLINFDNSNFENPKRIVKSSVISEDKTKSNSFVSPNRFTCLNNYKQCENSVGLNKEIVHNVTSSNKSATSRLDWYSCTKELSKEPV